MQKPMVDDKNPCYCPAISAESYLNTLRQALKLKTTLFQHDQSLYSFAMRLGCHYANRTASICDFSRSPVLLSPAAFSTCTGSTQPSSPVCQYPENLSNHAPVSKHRSAFAHKLIPHCNQKRKRTPSDFLEDFIRSPKRGRSSETNMSITSNFEFFNAPYPLSYTFSQGDTSIVPSGSISDNDRRANIWDFEEALYGPKIGQETPERLHYLVLLLDAILPGAGLIRRFSHMDGLTHQKIADVLSENGHLNKRVLNVLRASRVHRLYFRPSIGQLHSLHVADLGALRVLDLPNSFMFLTEIDFGYTRIQDGDLVHIQRLPCLAKLSLENTLVSSGGIFLLTNLKDSLTSLNLTFAERVDNDAVPVLLLFSKLSFLALYCTGIDMDGLRRLAKVIHDEKRVIDIVIPEECEEYIDAMPTSYILHPEPPLISDPSACESLSDAALKRNLSTHAERNPSIIVTGIRQEMIERLTELLETIKMDLLVREMFCGDD